MTLKGSNDFGPRQARDDNVDFGKANDKQCGGQQPTANSEWPAFMPVRILSLFLHLTQAVMLRHYFRPHLLDANASAVPGMVFHR